MVAPAIIAGIKLASAFAPKILGLFADEGDKTTQVSQLVMDVASRVTGEQDEDKAIAALNADPVMALQFKKAVMEDKHVADRLAYADRAGAREMYNTKNEQQDKIAQNVMMWNLPAVLLLLVLQGAAMVFLEDKAELMALIGNAVGYVTNSLLKERQDVISFFFSSSLGSKLKTMYNKR